MSDSGIVNILGGANVNTVDTTNGGGVYVDGTAVDMTFQSVSSTNSMDYGIFVGLGATGSFTVTGLGNDVADKGSGGTIDNATMDGVNISGLDTVSLTSMTVTNAGLNGVFLDGILTTALIDNFTVDTVGGDGIFAQNFNGTSQLQVTGSMVANAVNGIFAQIFGDSATATIDNNMVTGTSATGIHLSSLLSDGPFLITGNMVTGPGGQDGIVVVGLTPTTTGNLTVADNTIDQVVNGITIFNVVNSTVDLTGNTIGATGTGLTIIDGTGSSFTVGGTVAGTSIFGVRAVNTAGPDMTVTFDGLEVTAAGGVGISLLTDGVGEIS